MQNDCDSALFCLMFVRVSHGLYGYVRAYGVACSASMFNF